MPAPEPFIWHTRIRFVDTDATGRIHYSALFRHIETAEDEFFRMLGRPYFATEHNGLSYPRVHVEADYKLPLLYDSEIGIFVRPTRIGSSSYTLFFEVMLDSKVAATATLIIACMSKATQKSHPLPDSLREALTPYAV
ncbi:MAG TPA: thioesterase family protein [Paludibaculum sp.]|jgi:YbgC/YbaW family acyl-CoA thioester hydrolase